VRFTGRPDPRHISTSYAERNNLNCRTFLRRLTRLTNAFSKKVENLVAALWLYFAHYNFVRIHGSLRITQWPLERPAMCGQSKKC